MENIIVNEDEEPDKLFDFSEEEKASKSTSAEDTNIGDKEDLFGFQKPYQLPKQLLKFLQR